LLMKRGISVRLFAFSAPLAGATAGIFWEAFSTMRADRWSTVADAGLCPLVAVGAAWFWDRRRVEVDRVSAR
jgi:hypothetical protein